MCCPGNGASVCVRQHAAQVSSYNAVDTDDDAAVSGRQSLGGGLAEQAVDVQCWGPAFLRGKAFFDP